MYHSPMCRSSVQHVVTLPTIYTDIAIGEMFVAHNGTSLGSKANLNTAGTTTTTTATTGDEHTIAATTAGATAINTPV
jgi:hypothetical protein